MEQGIIFIGAFSETIELALSLNKLIVGIIDTEEKAVIKSYGLIYVGTDDRVLNDSDLLFSNLFFITPDQPSVRLAIYKKYSARNVRYTNLISNRANISSTAVIVKSEGVMIQDLVNISSDVFIGKGVRINTGANIMHNCIVGDFSTIAPNAVLLGNVKVGAGAYIGANATILPNINVGAGAIVGAGSVVTKDVLSNTTVAGVPAAPLYRK